MARWGCQNCPALYGAWLSRCPRCGSEKELVMALSVCTECTTKYAVGSPRCPHCGSTDHVEDGQPMPKITVDGGPSSVTAGPDEPGYMPPAEAAPDAIVRTDAVLTADQAEELKAAAQGDDGADLPFGATVHPVTTAPEGGEESSPGSSSSASDAAPRTKSEPSETPSPSPARKTGSRSKKAPTDSSSAPSTDGEKTAPTSDSDAAEES